MTAILQQLGSLLLVAAVASACGDDGGGGDGGGGGGDGGGDADAAPPGGADAAAPDASTATRTVTGLVTHRHVTPDGVAAVPIDLTQADIAVLVPPAFTSHPGSGDASGEFTVPDVPGGEYYLKVDDTYLVRSGDAIDLSIDVLGRRDAAPATTSPTDLVLDVDNLRSWRARDELQLYSAGSGAVGLAMQLEASAGAPAVGDTALSGFTWDLTTANEPFLVDAGAGDTVIVTQRSTARDGEQNRFRRIVRAFSAASLTMVDGEASNLSETFAAVAQSEQLDVEWDRAAFDATLRAGAPLDEPYGYPALVLHTLPGAAERGFFHSSADLVTFEPGWTDDTSAIVASWRYGDPFPATWGRMVTATQLTYRFVGVGDAAPRAIFSSLSVDLPRGAVSGGAPIAALVGPVLEPRVAGRDAFGPLDRIGPRPDITWQPPAVGAAARYRVAVVELVDDGGLTVASTVASIDTTATEVTIPPGILQPGGTYVFHIQATGEAGIDLEAEPNRLALPWGVSSIAIGPATI
jgi:hypothetical protein